MTVEPTTKDKQITIDVPEDRVAEFYAFYGHFLAGFPGRRRRGHGPGGRGHRCRPHREGEQTAGEAPEQAQAGPEIQTA
ncbi:MAG: hypothetical protein QOJ35_2012 [Solirubrobacteraceae bacterium]|nr:hypothetical protein [Solirubrobacteraceae bacterium]